MDLLDTTFSYMRAKSPTDQVPLKEFVRNLWCNTSQSVARLPISRAFPVLTTTAVVYSFEFDTIISGRSMMKLLGWPEEALPSQGSSLTDNEYRKLAGNGFSAVLSGMILTVLYANPWAPWRV